MNKELHFKSEKQTWETPKAFFDQLNRLSDLAVKPPTSGGGYKAIINCCNFTFLMIKCKA